MHLNSRQRRSAKRLEAHIEKLSIHRGGPTAHRNADEGRVASVVAAERAALPDEDYSVGVVPEASIDSRWNNEL